MGIANQRLRVATMTALFTRKAITVARPIAVKLQLERHHYSIENDLSNSAGVD